VNERQVITPDMTLCLGKKFENIREFLLNLHIAYDLSVAKHSMTLELKFPQ